MSVYLDASALVKRYVDEPGRDEVERILVADPEWLTGVHTYTEVRLAMQRRLIDEDLEEGQGALEADWGRSLVVDLDEPLCRRAAELGEVAGTRTVAALHLAAAERAGGRAIPIVTFDVRLATAARALGFTVLGT